MSPHHVHSASASEAPPRYLSLSVALAAVLCVVAIAACGGSSSKLTASSNPHLALSECMRAHGVPNFPDPVNGPGGEGMPVNEVPGGRLTINGIPFSGPAFQAASTACKLLGGGAGRPGVSEATKVQQLTFAQCMRKHGVPNFPDPEFPSTGGIERPAVPGLNPGSPALRNAAATCNRI